jgi:hypothetical protein
MILFSTAKLERHKGKNSSTNEPGNKMNHPFIVFYSGPFVDKTFALLAALR